MQRLGFIHDMMDVKILILYVTARAEYPMTTQEIYEVCYQDDRLSYFDVCTAIPEMVVSGHLQEVEKDKFAITEKGRQDGELTADTLVFTLRQRAENAVQRFNRQTRRSSFVKTQVEECDNGEYTVRMSLDDQAGCLMKLELYAPDHRQAQRLCKLLERKAEEVYDLTMTELLDEEDEI